MIQVINQRNQRLGSTCKTLYLKLRPLSQQSSDTWTI